MSKEKTIHERMATIKAELSKCKIPKSGHNKYAGFKYHELQDFMPFINDLNAKHGVNTVLKFVHEKSICVMKLINVDNADDNYEVVIPFVEAQMLAKGGAPSTTDAIQRMGSTLTYNRRYLYMTAYDIVESDGVDALEPQQPKPAPKPQPLNEQRFADALKAIKEGKTTADKVRAYALTPEQEKQLKEFEQINKNKYEK